MTEEKKDEILTNRKRMALWLLMVMVKIIEPTKYSHEWDKELGVFKELLSKEK